MVVGGKISTVSIAGREYPVQEGAALEPLDDVLPRHIPLGIAGQIPIEQMGVVKLYADMDVDTVLDVFSELLGERVNEVIIDGIADARTLEPRPRLVFRRPPE